MKKLKYFILLLFICSVLFFAEDRDYNSWLGNHRWLMTKPEIRAFKKAKTDQGREKIIKQFWKARDLDAFTYKNEFKLIYEKNLKIARKDYPDLRDSRRYIFLLYGKPDSKHIFVDQIASIVDIRIRVSKGEIWHYRFGKQTFRVIFAKIVPRQVQQARDQQGRRQFSPFSFRSSKYEILYIGPRAYTDIVNFLESFFQENFRLIETSDTINHLKKPILQRAKEFYKKSQPKVKKEKYSHEWNQEEIRVFINQFDVKSPDEVNVVIWILFDKDSLYFDSKKKKYKADISLYCEIKDLDNKRIIYYQNNCIHYKLKDKKRYYYHFWGSLPSGNYKFTLELGDNIGKRYTKLELLDSKTKKTKNLNIFDYSQPGFKVTLLAGKIVKDKNTVQGKPSYFFFKQGMFYPAGKGEPFYGDDELIVFCDISGFEKNHYGNSHLNLSLNFVKGKMIKRVIEDGVEKSNFVSTGEIYKYRLLAIEENCSRVQRWARIKIKEFNKKFKILPGMYLYEVILLIKDAVANREYHLKYSCLIRILSTFIDANTLNNLRRRN